MDNILLKYVNGLLTGWSGVRPPMILDVRSWPVAVHVLTRICWSRSFDLVQTLIIVELDCNRFLLCISISFGDLKLWHRIERNIQRTLNPCPNIHFRAFKWARRWTFSFFIKKKHGLAPFICSRNLDLPSSQFRRIPWVKIWILLVANWGKDAESCALIFCKLFLIKFHFNKSSSMISWSQSCHVCVCMLV